MRILATGLLLAIQITPASAELTIIRLVCAYEYSISDGKQSGTSGENLVTVHYHSENGAAAITKQGVGAIFIGSVTEEQIIGKAEYKFGDTIDVKQMLNINRFTGRFELSFEVSQNDSVLIHYGKCRPATKPLF